MRYLTIRVIYPQPEHRDDVLAVARRVADAARQFEGLVDVGAWVDEEDDRIVVMSLWESEEYAAKARQGLHSTIADVPWSEWERKPSENMLRLVRAV